jgi:hypothetical protein
MGLRHRAVLRQASSAGMVPVAADQSHIFLIRRVSNIDHGAGNELTQSLWITAPSSGIFGD